MKKRALVTGASRGIGAACARALTGDGFDTVINYVNSEKAAEDLADELGCTAVKADVSDCEQVEKMFERTGDVDVLVVNAGIALPQKLFTDISFEEWRRIFAVNVDGAYNCCRAAIPGMVRKKWGRIVIMSSMWGIRGASCETAYAASKAALIGLGRSLARELGPSGITVNVIAPGVIDTDMNGALGSDVMESLCGETPVMRLGKPEDVASLCAYLCSDRAEFITGQVISADGGYTV